MKLLLLLCLLETDPAYWGLKKGEPIPHSNCWIGSWPGKKWAYETCSRIVKWEVVERNDR